MSPCDEDDDTPEAIQTVQMTVEVIVHDDPTLDDYDLKKLPEVVSDSLCGVLIDHLGAGISVRVSPAEQV